MPVFNLSLKILKKNIPTLSIYFVVFVMVSTIMMFITRPAEQGLFTETKTNMAIIAEENSPLIEGLRKNLSRIANFVEIEDTTESLQDALFFRRVEYILRIPAGFTEAILAGGEPRLYKTIVPDSARAVHIDMLIDRFFNIAKLYAVAMPDEDLSVITDNITGDMSQETRVELISAVSGNGQLSRLMIFFNFIAYSLMFALIFGIGCIVITLNKLDIKRRSICSPIKPSRFYTEIYLATTLFTLLCWLVLVLLSLAFGYDEIDSPATAYYVLNSFVFALCAGGLSFLIGNVFESKNAINAIANVITLGSSFLSGVFVPRFLIGENVLRVASFFPTYWYVRANERINSLISFEWNIVADVYWYILIQFGFAVMFFIAALVAGKYRNSKT